MLLAETKPEGALKQFIDTYKHSGLVRYIRGSGRRAPDLRRAGVTGASAVLVLNYRADKDAAFADTEVRVWLLLGVAHWGVCGRA